MNRPVHHFYMTYPQRSFFRGSAFSMPRNKKGRDKIITRVSGTVTGGHSIFARPRMLPLQSSYERRISHTTKSTQQFVHCVRHIRSIVFLSDTDKFCQTTSACFRAVVTHFSHQVKEYCFVFHTNFRLKHGTEHSGFFVLAKLSAARRTGGTRERNEAKPA